MNWCSPIMWHDNVSLPRDLYDKICSIVSDKLVGTRTVHVSNNDTGKLYYTTYGEDGSDWPADVIEQVSEFYEQLFVSKMMFQLGMLNRSEWKFNYWIQGSNCNTIGHKPHTHFSGNEIISWCHIIKAPIPDEPCFHFFRNTPEGTIDGEGYRTVFGTVYEKLYPEQKTGDINAWPAWSMHAVDATSSEENRIVIAGNISLEKMTDGESIMEHKRDGMTVTWNIKELS